MSQDSPSRFHALPLRRAPHCTLGSGQHCVNGGIQRRVLALEHHARQTAQDDFDSARLIDAATRSVHIVYANTDALDEARVFSKFGAELASDVVSLDGSEIGLGRANVDGPLLWLRRGFPLR